MHVVALRMLFGDPTKYLGLVLGVAFTTLLVNQQVGLLLGLLGRAGSAVEDASEVDLWVMDPGVSTLDLAYPLRDTELPRLRAIPGVLWAAPLFRGGAAVRNDTGGIESTLVFGVDDVSLVGIPQTLLAGNLADLRQPQAVALDGDGYRRIWPGEPYRVGRILELNDRRAEVVAIVKALPSFASGPVIYTRYTQALQYTNNGRNQLSFVLIKLAPGADAEVVASRIEQSLNLKARTREQFRQDNIQFVINNTGIPTSFATVVALGVIVGLAIVGLLTNLFVLENLKQFATLKAIGIRNSRLLGMVLLQVFTAGSVGWVLGLVGAAAFFAFAGQGDPNFRGFFLPWYVAAASAILAALIILLAATLSLRRVLMVDPATVFRN